MNKTNIFVKFSISGEEFNPNIVTSILSINPTNCWRKGDCYRTKSNTTLMRKYSNWEIRSKKEESFDMGTQMNKILDLFIGKESLFVDLKSKYDINFIIFVVIVVEKGETPAIYLDERTIKFANDIGATFDFDLYVNSFEDDFDEDDYLN